MGKVGAVNSSDPGMEGLVAHCLWSTPQQGDIKALRNCEPNEGSYLGGAQLYSKNEPLIALRLHDISCRLLPSNLHFMYSTVSSQTGGRLCVSPQ